MFAARFKSSARHAEAGNRHSNRRTHQLQRQMRVSLPMKGLDLFFFALAVIVLLHEWQQPEVLGDAVGEGFLKLTPFGSFLWPN